MTRRTVGLVLAGLAGLAAVACGDAAWQANRSGNESFAQGLFQQALERYDQVLALRPDYLEAEVNAGNALHRLEEYGPSLDRYAQAGLAENLLTLVAAAYGRGSSLFRLDRLDEARESFKDVLRLDPDNREAKFNIEVIDRLQQEQEQQQQQQQQEEQQGEDGEGEGEQGEGQGEGQPQQGSGQGDQGQQGDPGQTQEGQQGQQPGQGNEGTPEPSGPPPSVPDALREFREELTPDQALRLLDALRDEQRSLEGVLEGVPRPAPPVRGGPPPQAW